MRISSRIQRLGFLVWGLGFGVGFRVYGGFLVQGLGFRVDRSRVSRGPTSSGFRVYCSVLIV